MGTEPKVYDDDGDDYTLMCQHTIVELIVH